MDCSHFLQQNDLHTTTKQTQPTNMIFHPAAYAMLLLSSRDLRPVRGDAPKDTDTGPLLELNSRQLKKGGKDGSKDAVGLNGDIDLLKYPCSSRDKKD